VSVSASVFLSLSLALSLSLSLFLTVSVFVSVCLCLRSGLFCLLFEPPHRWPRAAAGWEIPRLHCELVRNILAWQHLATKVPPRGCAGLSLASSRLNCRCSSSHAFGSTPAEHENRPGPRCCPGGAAAALPKLESREVAKRGHPTKITQATKAWSQPERPKGGWPCGPTKRWP